MKIKFHIFDTLQKAYEYRHEPEAMRVLAETFWRTLLVVAALLIILWAWFGLSQLLGVMGEVQPNTGAVSGILPLNRTQLDATVQALSTRAAQVQSLIAAPVTVTDPSVAK